MSETASSAAPLTLAMDGAVAVITLNRPSSLNAIDLSMAQALRAAVSDVAGDSSVHALLLRGEGRSFCGGGDVKAMQSHAHELPSFVGQIIDAFHDAVLALVRLPVPVVVAVQGAAAGGGFSLAMAADLVVAAQSSRFVVAYPQLGTSTDGGLSWQLQQRLGPARALALMALQGPITAEAAIALNLVHEVVKDDALPFEALRLARSLAAPPPQAMRELKALVYSPLIDSLAQHLAREKAAFQRCAATADFAVRVAAFARRSAPA
jgi:2-(1,2-epoxy-1,2-dihydrophenyl)acetyl-CoA isomerase